MSALGELLDGLDVAPWQRRMILEALEARLDGQAATQVFMIPRRHGRSEVLRRLERLERELRP